jgi:2',3'-cyclic-nucleotide 2'-phosphodiesterase
MSGELRVLAVGDAIGRPGRLALKKVLPAWKKEGRADCIIANGENSAGGRGVTLETARDFFDAGVDVITTGNHVWDNKDIFKFIDDEPRILRPANYPMGMDIPGRGCGVFTCPSTGFKIGVMNLMGRVHMEPLECPFRCARTHLQQLREQTNIIFVDFHAEATSEKVAMGWFLDGQVTCVFGTHTHVPTADERLLHHGTAFICDIGMSGSYDSIIGVKMEPVLNRFLTGIPARHEVAEENVKVSGILVTVDPLSGRALAIERFLENA